MALMEASSEVVKKLNGVCHLYQALEEQFEIQSQQKLDGESVD